jgi:hypothetical protein
MARKVELPRTLTIRGEEVDCLVHCEVSGEDVEIDRVTVDEKDGAAIPPADWPEGLVEQVWVAALETASEQELDAREDPPHCDDDFGDER